MTSLPSNEVSTDRVRQDNHLEESRNDHHGRTNQTSPSAHSLAVVPFVPRPLMLARSHDEELVLVGRGVQPPVAICPTCRRPLEAFDVVFDDDVSEFQPAVTTMSDLNAGDTLGSVASAGGGSSGGGTSRRGAENQADESSPHVAVAPYSRRHPSSDHRGDGGGATRRHVWTPMYFRSLGGSSPPNGAEQHPTLVGVLHQQTSSANSSNSSTPLPRSGISPAASERTPANVAASDGGTGGGGGGRAPIHGCGNVNTDEREDDERAEEEDHSAVGLEATAEELLMQQGYYARHFSEVHRIGGGSYGAVYLCRHVMEHQTLGLFAVKKIPVGDDSAYFLKVLREVRVMEEIKRHPNVLEYHHSWIDYARTADFGPVVRCLFVLMEYATEGSLDEYVERRNHGSSLSNLAVWYFFLSALAGLAHLHSKNILHRDLKPQNLLLTKEDFGRAPRLLVADFGAAALLGELSLHERTGGTGTLEYMAPELLVLHETLTATAPSGEGLGNAGTERGDSGNGETGGCSRAAASAVGAERFEFQSSKASDVWSLGMVLHYLACDATLPTVLSDGTVLLNVDDHSPIERPTEMKELLRAMLNRDPTKRPTCADILQAPYIRGVLRSLENIDFSKQYGSRQGSRASLSGSATERSRKQHPPLLLEDVAGRGGKRRRFPVERSPPAVQSPAQQRQPQCAGGSGNFLAPPVVERCTQTDAMVVVDEAEWSEFLQWRSRRTDGRE